MDINLFRDPAKAELVRESQRRRFAPVEQVDLVIKVDEDWRKARFAVDQANKAKNAISKEVQAAMKAKQKADELIAKAKEATLAVEKAMKDEAALKQKLADELYKIGNLVHQSVRVSKDEANNEIYRTWGLDTKKSGGELKHHHELLHMIGGYDPERGVKVAGHRGYFLTGVGVALNQAIINYGLQFLTKRKYKTMQTPMLMKKELMGRVAQLSDYDETLYKVPGEESDMYLIATSEQPLAALHVDEWMDPATLPVRYGGVSSCFRKEAGAHGKDTWGIFRVHQFEKVEQFVITSPETSWEMHEEMLKTSEEFYQSLGIPYQVVVIVSGELNNAAAKKYDLEGWYPGFQEFRELVSCSNCTDYQARRMEIRYGAPKKDDDTKHYVHMLNSTLTATGRTICAILENNQTDKGINVPPALQPFLAGYLEDATFIPFVNEPPKEKPQPNKKAEPKKGK